MYVATMQYVSAVLLAHAKDVALLEPLPPSAHGYKYRLYYGAGGVCRIRYDNERGKGDHRHVGGREEDYLFRTLEELLEDFRRDVDNWRQP